MSRMTTNQSEIKISAMISQTNKIEKIRGSNSSSVIENNDIPNKISIDSTKSIFKVERNF